VHLTYTIDDDGVKPKLVEVTSAAHEFYLRYLGRDASMAQAARVDDWWAAHWPRIERDLDGLPMVGGVMASAAWCGKSGHEIRRCRQQTATSTSVADIWREKAQGVGTR